MFLLLVRSAALALLLSFAVTAERDVTCQQEVPPELIRDLWNRTQQLIKSLPREKTISRRLLPRFCTDCSERTIGWLEMQEVMDVYQRSVFSREVVRRLLPLHYEDLLYRLQQTLQHCSLTQAEVITNPPFSSVISSLNTSCQGREELRLMNVTLDVYMRIFSNILHHQHKPGTSALLDQVSDSQRSKLKEDLKELRGKMEALKRHLNHPSHDREDVVNKLNKIKVDDPLVQKKALAQFKEVFQAASVVVDRRC